MAPLSFDATKWTQVWFTQILLPTDKRLVAPVTIGSRIIALMMTSVGWTDSDKWKLGAYIQREIFSGLIVGGITDARFNGSRKLFVNRLQIFTYSEEVNCSLVINPLIWGNGTSIAVWEYMGEIN